MLTLLSCRVLLVWCAAPAESLNSFYSDNADLLDPKFLEIYQESAARNSDWLKNTAPQLCAWLSK
jgi:hypothetical protein